MIPVCSATQWRTPPTTRTTRSAHDEHGEEPIHSDRGTGPRLLGREVLLPGTRDADGLRPGARRTGCRCCLLRSRTSASCRSRDHRAWRSTVPAATPAARGIPTPADGLSRRSMAARSEPTNSAAPSGPAPSSRRRTSAEPTTTPSATSHTAAAWSGVDTPMPTQTGRSVWAWMRTATCAGRVGQDGLLARHPHPTHGVDEATRPLADGGDALVGGRGCHQQHGGHVLGVGRRGPAPDLLERQVRDDRPATRRTACIDPAIRAWPAR